MADFLDLFSPETYEAFSKSDRAISGFRQRHQNAASRVKVGDKRIQELAKQKHLAHLSDSVIDEYAEEAE